MRKRLFAYAKNKGADQLCGYRTAYRTADQRLCFGNIVQSLYLLNLKFQSSSYFQRRLYSSVSVGPGRKPRRPVFSRRGSNKVEVKPKVTVVGDYWIFSIMLWA